MPRSTARSLPPPLASITSAVAPVPRLTYSSASRLLTCTAPPSSAAAGVCLIVSSPVVAVIVSPSSSLSPSYTNRSMLSRLIAVVRPAETVVVLLICLFMLAVVPLACRRTRSNQYRMVCGTNLSGLGKARVMPARVGTQRFYRVRLGPIRSVGEADRMLKALVASGHTDARIVVN